MLTVSVQHGEVKIRLTIPVSAIVILLMLLQ